MNKQNLDKRYKKTQLFLSKGIGEPVYKRRAFPYIDKVLGRQYKWIHKSPEEYFGNERYEEIKLALSILSFSREESFGDVRKRYIRLSQGSYSDNVPGWHPDCGGHPGAFAILNHAYNIFKEASSD